MKLSLTCTCPINLIQKQSDLSYRDFLLDLNFQTKILAKESKKPFLYMP